jgi:branched-chain amino acid transport system ATP-binding protein
VRDLSVRFGGIRAVNDVSLRVPGGEIIGIIGPNGAGKTTLFDLISGYTRPSSGRVLFGRDDVTSLSPDARARRGLGAGLAEHSVNPPIAGGRLRALTTPQSRII